MAKSESSVPRVGSLPSVAQGRAALPAGAEHLHRLDAAAQQPAQHVAVDLVAGARD
jgi:hypothetical protein